MLISGLPTEFLNYEAGVLPAETKTVGHDYVEICFPGDIRNVIKVAIRVCLFLVDRWVHDPIVDAVDANDGF